MAIHQRNSKYGGPTRKIVGKFTLTGNKQVTRLTISRDLDHEPFPNSSGSNVVVHLIEPEDDDESAYLEVHPVDS